MQLLSKIELSTCATKSGYEVIYGILNSTISEIKSINGELTTIRDKTVLLENKNEILVKQFQDIMDTIANMQFVDSCCQSDVTEVHDIGVNCDERPKCIDVSVDVKPDTTPDTVPAKDIATEVSLVEVDVIQEAPKVVDPVAVVQEPINNQSYSKEDMLFYLENYKISFISFLQCNKNDIVDISGGCNDLIRSFSTSSLTERKRPSKREPRESSKRRREEKPGVIETGTTGADTGIMSSLYDDLDYQDPLGQERQQSQQMNVLDTEMQKVGGEKRVATMSSQPRFVKRSKKVSPESWKCQISNLESTHASMYDTAANEPRSDQPMSNDGVIRTVQVVERSLFSRRMKEKCDNKYGKKIEDNKEQYLVEGGEIEAKQIREGEEDGKLCVKKPEAGHGREGNVEKIREQRKEGDGKDKARKHAKVDGKVELREREKVKESGKEEGKEEVRKQEKSKEIRGSESGKKEDRVREKGREEREKGVKTKIVKMPTVVVKYDLSNNTESPLFSVTDTEVQEQPASTITHHGTHKSQIKSTSKHLAKKKSTKKEKELEEGEIA